MVPPAAEAAAVVAVATPAAPVIIQQKYVCKDLETENLTVSN